MFAKNLFPNPAPSDAPLTIPAMSTNETEAGNNSFDSKIVARVLSLSSGTPTIPTFGSMVAKG